MSFHLIATPDVSPRAYRSIAYDLEESIQRTGSSPSTFSVSVKNPGVGQTEITPVSRTGQTQRYDWRDLLLPHIVKSVSHNSSTWDILRITCIARWTAKGPSYSTTTSPIPITTSSRARHRRSVRLSNIVLQLWADACPRVQATLRSLVSRTSYEPHCNNHHFFSLCASSSKT